MRTITALLCLALLLPACAEDSGGLFTAEQDAALSDGRVWTRLHTDAPGKLRRALFEAGADVTGSHHRLGFVDILTTPAERDRLLERHAARIRRSSALDTRAASRALSDYLDPAEVEAILDQVAADHPNIAQKVTLQAGLPEGGVIHAMKISDNAAVDEDEPTYLMDGQIHAREVMTAEVMIDAIEVLTDGYGVDAQVTRWVDEMEIWIVPVLNPDGASYVHDSDNWWRKNRSHECGADVGVDLNRNFAWSYRQCPGSDDYCSSDVYHGPAAASELETQAAQDLMALLRPMYYINYHSYGEYIIWPGGCGRLDEQALLSLVGEELNQRVENDAGQTGQWATGTAPDVLYQAPGGAEDHAYGAAGAVAFCFELNAGGFQPDFDTYRDVTCQRQRAAWGHLLDRTLDGPAVTGHSYDADTLAPLQAGYSFANHPFSSGQLPLETDHHGRFGRAVLPDSEHVMVFTAAGYLPATHAVDVAGSPVDIDVPMQAGVNHAPTAAVGPDQIVSEGDTVVLDASGSSDPDGNTLFFNWTQLSGPAVELVDAWSAQPSFFAPGVDADQDLVFEVVASDGELDSDPAGVTVTVRYMWDEQTIYDSNDTPIDIPDDDQTGIASVIHVAEDRPILATAVHVDITHTYIGDLRVGLLSPAGTEVVLHDRDGGSTEDLHADYAPLAFSGELSGGDWTLWVTDLAGADTGRLEGWSLTLELVGEPGCQSAADCDLDHVAVHDCVDGRCEIVDCDANWADCNGSAADGCEIDTASDLDHCGGCDAACTFDHAGAVCEAGNCSMVACDAGYGDCNSDPTDGCEAELDADPENCGACGDTCDLAHATAGCSGGACTVAACDDLWGDCNADPDDGCEADVATDEDNCGACGNVCTLAHADAVCTQGACAIDTCQGTWNDCNGLPGDGCERDLDSDVDHCGACDHSCHALNAEVSCGAGTCIMGDCLAGFGDCNQDAGDGCEADLNADAQHCGACDVSCDLPHAQGRCLTGECLIDSCDAGWGNCNGALEDGCEADLNADAQHCGGCDQACDLPHATAGCTAGACTVAACDVGFGECNDDAADGCETYLNNNPDHCGACGAVCSLDHASAQCRQGDCMLESCDTGWGNCNRDSADGCEVDLGASAEHCGDCGNACAFDHASAGCDDGACSLEACDAGWGDCNADAADGCETDLSSDAAHCGGCDQACPDGERCQDGSCAAPCPDADGDGAADAACGGDDCDDGDAQVGPHGTEVCNDRDDDCDGETDEQLDCGDGGCGCAGAGRPGAPWLGLGLLLLLAGLIGRRQP